MINPSLAATLQEGLALHLGTRNDRLEPSGARASAVKIEEDRRHLVVYVAEAVAHRVLPNLESNGLAAVVFCRPVDDWACQVKGTFAGARPAAEDERAFVETQWEGFIKGLGLIGIPPAIVARWTCWPAVAIRLEATALFDQTPRPGAGGPLA